VTLTKPFLGSGAKPQSTLTRVPRLVPRLVPIVRVRPPGASASGASAPGASASARAPAARGAPGAGSVVSMVVTLRKRGVTELMCADCSNTNGYNKQKCD